MHLGGWNALYSWLGAQYFFGHPSDACAYTGEMDSISLLQLPKTNIVQIIIRARITLTRKIVVCLMFSAGVFVMVAATLRVVFYFTVHLTQIAQRTPMSTPLISPQGCRPHTTCNLVMSRDLHCFLCDQFHDHRPTTQKALV